MSDFPWALGIYDAHCHPTDTVASLDTIRHMRARVLTIMATRAQDQELVAHTADTMGLASAASTKWGAEQKVLPAFGWHPWFSHHMFDEGDYDGANSLQPDQKIAHYQAVLTPVSSDRDFLLSMPDPRPLGHFIQQTRDYLRRYPFAIIGEVGLDKSFRIPETWLPEQVEDRDDTLTPGGREGRRLSPYRVTMEHQRKVVLAQLRLAGEQRRAVSMHGVQAHGVVYETLASTWKGYEKPVQSKRQKAREAKHPVEQPQAEQKPRPQTQEPKPFPPRICLHSFSGPADTVKLYTAPSVPCDVYFSFSTTINSWAEDGNGKSEAAVAAVPNDRLLVESDLHTAGDEMDGYLEGIVRKLCQLKGWQLEEGVRQLGSNWKRFALGLED